MDDARLTFEPDQTIVLDETPAPEGRTTATPLKAVRKHCLWSRRRKSAYVCPNPARFGRSGSVAGRLRSLRPRSPIGFCIRPSDRLPARSFAMLAARH